MMKFRYAIWLLGFFGPVGAGQAAPPPANVTAAAMEAGAPPATPHALHGDWSYGGRLELEYLLERNYDLSTAVADDRVEWQPVKPSLAFSWHPESPWLGYVNFELDKKYIAGDQSGADPDAALLLDKAFIEYRWPEGSFLRLGRQRVKDSREWMFDDTFDGLRLTLRRTAYELDAAWLRERAFTENLSRPDPVQKVDHLWLRLSQRRGDRKQAIWAVRQTDDRRDERVSWLGLEHRGKWEDLDYWLVGSLARGSKRGERIDGFGFDIGGIYRLYKRPRIFAIAGWAFGSGDPNDADLGFRQTDFQDNNAKLGGVTRFVYYGEAFDPELSNLSILTAGVGIRPIRDASVILIGHHYTQQEPLDELRESDLSVEPEGNAREIGAEIDLVFGYRWQKRLRAELVLGRFFPGSAFADRDPADLFKFQLRYRL